MLRQKLQDVATKFHDSQVEPGSGEGHVTATVKIACRVSLDSRVHAVEGWLPTPSSRFKLSHKAPVISCHVVGHVIILINGYKMYIKNINKTISTAIVGSWLGSWFLCSSPELQSMESSEHGPALCPEGKDRTHGKKPSLQLKAASNF